MNNLEQFTLPVKGLHAGLHQYNFEVSTNFFKSFDSQIIESGRFEVQVDLIKNPDMLILNVSFSGFWDTLCDRCISDIKVPVSGQNTTLIKFGPEEVDEGEIIYIVSGTSEINIAPYIYEHICTGLPFRKTCDDMNGRNDSCDSDFLKILSHSTENNVQSNETWSILGGLQLEEE